MVLFPEPVGPQIKTSPDFLRDPFTENFGRETKRFQIRNVATNSTEDGRVSTKLSEQVDPEPNAFSRSKTRIMILSLFGGAAGSAERIEERAVERSGLERPKFSGDSQQRRTVLMKKQIGSLVCFEQLCTSFPLSLKKSHSLVLKTCFLLIAKLARKFREFRTAVQAWVKLCHTSRELICGKSSTSCSSPCWHIADQNALAEPGR